MRAASFLLTALLEYGSVYKDVFALLNVQKRLKSGGAAMFEELDRLLTPDVFAPYRNNAEQLIQSMIGDMSLSAKVTQQVLEKAEGNPFYLEEWVNLMQDLHDIEQRPDLPVPKTLTALVLSRIDRLDWDIKLLLQKAAVIGNKFFAAILVEIEKKLQRPENISLQLAHLETSDFVHRIPDSQYSPYLFKHVITQEVAYNTLLIANRKILHRITAEVIEEQFTENIEEFYYDLAEHYSKAGMAEKTREYLKKAGDKAKAGYDNEKAVEFYDRLLLMYNEFIAQRIDTLLEKGQVLELTGKWRRCEDVYGEALRFSEEIDDKGRIGEAHRALGTIFRLQGEYEQAMTHYGKSLALFQRLGDRTGISKAVGNIGVVSWRKGDYGRAMTCFEKDLQICEELEDKQGISKVVTNMGIVHEDKGDYNAAMTCYKRSLQICEELGDKQGISIAMGNMGVVYKGKNDYNAAMVSYQKALKMKEELDDKAGVSRITANMGELHSLKGDYDAAMACYETRLKICEELGNKQGISIAVGNMGEIYKVKSDYDAALTCYNRAIEIDRELGRKSGLVYQLIAKAEVLFLLERFDEARLVNVEGQQAAQEVGRQAKIFQSNVLSAKIDFVLDKQEHAVTLLTEMLAQTKDNAQRAELHYELSQFGVEHENHRKEALRLYQKLYEKTPKVEWKKRIEKLKNKMG
ncbi:MAG: tetratricopeptide repeat protein [bacterium]|nr:tetratricopeptide repeat protein [bacterium]